MSEINNELNLQHDQLKQKISSSLENLNKSTFVFDEMISDYNLLYQKYIDIQLAQEQNPRLNNMSISIAKKEIITKNDEEDYNFLKDKYFKLKETNEQNLQEIRKNLENIMKLKEKVEIQDKKIKGYQAENSALKSQNIQLDKKNKELNKINEENEKKIFQLNKSNQRMEIDHKKLIENTVQMHQDLDELRNKILEMQTSNFKKDLDIIPNQSSDDFSQNKNEIFSKNEINLNIVNTGRKLPNKLKYKQKVHHKSITSISFNNVGNKYITSSEDNTLILSDATKNSEISKFSGFTKTVSESHFNKSNQLILAGSYDATVKLINAQNFNLISNFIEHSSEINSVKCFHHKDRGLTGSSDKTIKEWDFENKKLLQEFNYKSECYSLCISSDDKFILSGHGDGVVNMWTGDNNKNSKLFKLHKDKVIDVIIAKDNSFLSLGKDKSIKLFDLRTEKEIYTINEDKINEICESNIALSPDKNFFTIGSKEGYVYIININNGEIEETINNNNGRGEVTSIKWNNNNHHIYIGDSKGFISIWGNDFE